MDLDFTIYDDKLSDGHTSQNENVKDRSILDMWVILIITLTGW